VKRKRNPVEVVLVWGLIGVLCVVALIELAAKLSYDRALAGLTNARAQQTRNDPFTRSDALASVPRKPVETTTEVDGAERKTYVWTWFSLFKTYRIELYVTAKDDYVIDFRTGETSSRSSDE
jgi:hypothetical protein